MKLYSRSITYIFFILLAISNQGLLYGQIKAGTIPAPVEKEDCFQLSAKATDSLQKEIIEPVRVGSLEEGIYWIKKAAEEGNIKAQFLLGGIYSKGLGVKESFRDAAKWHAKAAAQGHPEAAYKLGKLFISDYEIDQRNAAKFYFLGLKNQEGMQDHPVFVLGRHYMYSGQYFKANECFETLLKNSVEVDAENYLKDLREECNKGIPIICNVLGRAYLQGVHLPRNNRKAEKWIKKAEKKSRSPD